jgi:hypothetical protein
MKSLKVCTLIIGAILCIPSASFADNIINTNQSVNQESIVIGNGNTVKSDVRQSIVDLQTSGDRGTSVGYISQRINAKTIIIGNGNIDIKSAVQAATNRPKNN